jgi:RimJ/RimL family protein N-acetyltransferase
MIYGERLRLRAAEREDVPRFHAWLNDNEVNQYLSLTLPFSLAAEERWFENMERQPAAEHVLVIEIREGDGWKPIGNISLMDVNSINRTAEVGLFIGEKSLWSQGYGSEALALMLKHAFETVNLHRVWLRVFEHNPRGIRAYEKVGFVHEGRMRQALYQNGRYQDILIMSVLRDEWQPDGS